MTVQKKTVKTDRYGNRPVDPFQLLAPRKTGHDLGREEIFLFTSQGRETSGRLHVRCRAQRCADSAGRSRGGRRGRAPRRRLRRRRFSRSTAGRRRRPPRRRHAIAVPKSDRRAATERRRPVRDQLRHRSRTSAVDPVEKRGAIHKWFLLLGYVTHFISASLEVVRD